MKILIIDDDHVFLKIAETQIIDFGCQTNIACNITEAIQILQNKTTDLIICDIFLPGVSGLSLITLIKYYLLIKTPIIMMSSNDNHILGIYLYLIDYSI